MRVFSALAFCSLLGFFVAVAVAQPDHVLQAFWGVALLLLVIEAGVLVGYLFVGVLVPFDWIPPPMAEYRANHQLLVVPALVLPFASATAVSNILPAARSTQSTSAPALTSPSPSNKPSKTAGT